VTALRSGSAPLPGSSRRVPSDPDAELASLLAAPSLAAAALAASDIERLLPLLRSCGFAANGAGDFEAAQNWFDCSFALSGALCDLLSAANMRAKLSSTSATAAAIYRHALADGAAGDKVKGVAKRKLDAVEEAVTSRNSSREASAGKGSNGDIAYGTNA